MQEPYQNEDEDTVVAASSPRSINDYEPATPEEDLSVLVIALLKGVLYREDDERLWHSLMTRHVQVRDYVSVMNLSLLIDEAEGYAFLRSRADLDDEQPGTAHRLRLVRRTQLSFPVSLLLALFRRRLTEFDSQGDMTRPIMTRDQIAEMLYVFLPTSSNVVSNMKTFDVALNKTIELGFVKKMSPSGEAAHGATPFEIKRIIKTFVDAQWLEEFNQKLSDYHAAAVADSTTDNDNEEAQSDD